MKNNQKGFTLIELLAVIVLLGVILTISVLSISSISRAVKTKQKENLVSSIKVAAKKYVNDTEVKKVYVETLITEGLIEADDETNIVYDPETNESLNCYYVDYTNENDPQLVSGDCNPEIMYDSVVSVKYCIATAGSECTPNKTDFDKWLSSDQIYLGATSGTLTLSDPNVSYSWISPLAPDVYNDSKKYKVEIPESQYINDVYEVIITIDGKIYTGSTRLKVDLKKPDIKDILVTHPEEYKKEKTISAKVQDGESGLGKYIITKSNTMPTSGWKNISGSEIKEDITENGTWYVWVKDNVGNVNVSDIEVHKIDREAPIFKDISVTYAEEYKKEKTIIALIQDEGIGLSEYIITQSNTEPTSGWTSISGAEKEVTLNINKNGTWYVWAKDELGNVGKGSIEVHKIDTVAPKCTNGGDNSTWTNKNIIINYGCDDGNGENDSGCDPNHSGGSKTFSTSTKTATIEAYTIKDKAGNETKCSQRTASVYVDKTAPKCTSSGDNSTWTNQNVKIYYGCNDGSGDAVSGCNSSYSGGSTTFSTSTKTATIEAYTIKDKAGNVTKCSQRTANVYVDKTSPKCTNSGDNSTWTNQNVIINYGCNDGLGDAVSGCNSSYSGGSTTFSSTTKTSVISAYTIKDKAGNQTKCPQRTASVYVDKTKPSATSFGISSRYSYNSKYATVTVSGSDSHSGVSKICITSSNSTSGCSWQNFNGSYNINYNFSGSEGSGTSYTLYAFVKDSVGNVSSAKSSTYRLYQACSNTYISGYGSYGACSVSCGGGYKYRDVYYSDYYLNTSCGVDYEGSRSPNKCNTQSCCSEGTYSYNYCDDYGYEVHRRYNGCLGKYEYKDTSIGCYTDYYSCGSWGTCSGGIQYKGCYYMYKGREYYDSYAKSQYCEEKDPIYDYRYNGCDEYYITECDDTYCEYTRVNGYSSYGSIRRRSLTLSAPSSCYEPDTSFCDNSSSSLFGTSKGSHSGNSGSAYYPPSSWGKWCHSNGTTCYASVGYTRICSRSSCGEYYGWSAKEINNYLGCDFATYWCSC